jgi:hypothetical protein
VKRSIAAIASRWLFKNEAHLFAGSGFLSAFLIQRKTVRPEISSPNIFNSSSMHGVPQVGFSATVRKIRPRNSLLTHFLPVRFRCHESQVQYNLNPVRCQRTTVSGWTRTNARSQLVQSRCNTIQSSRSEAEGRGCGYRCFQTTSCCRRAKFSKSNSLRERMSEANSSLSRGNIPSVCTRTGQIGRTAYLHNSKGDRYFGERQVRRGTNAQSYI